MALLCVILLRVTVADAALPETVVETIWVLWSDVPFVGMLLPAVLLVIVAERLKFEAVIVLGKVVVGGFDVEIEVVNDVRISVVEGGDSSVMLTRVEGSTIGGDLGTVVDGSVLIVAMVGGDLCTVVGSCLLGVATVEGILCPVVGGSAMLGRVGASEEVMHVTVTVTAVGIVGIGQSIICLTKRVIT